MPFGMDAAIAIIEAALPMRVQVGLRAVAPVVAFGMRFAAPDNSPFGKGTCRQMHTGRRGHKHHKPSVSPEHSARQLSAAA